MVEGQANKASFSITAKVFELSGLDTPSIRPWYSEYQALILIFDTLVKLSKNPSVVQEMQEMQDFAGIFVMIP